MPRPCKQDHPPSPGTCHFCHLIQIDPAYAVYWGEQTSATAAIISPRCIFRQDATGERINCPSCRGNVSLTVFGCMKHQKCVPMQVVSGIQSCIHCADRVPNHPQTGVGQVRHLAYHLYPRLDRNEVWRQNLRMLFERLSLFNGLRLCGVAVGPETLCLEAVKGLLEPWGFTIIPHNNIPNRREGSTYLDLLSVLSQYQGEGDCFFFGHAKGISLPEYETGSRLWREALYRLCLDYWPFVAQQLAHYPIVGPFLRPGFRFAENPHCSWHYSGSFRWCRSRDVFQRNWKQLHPSWTCVETWPSSIFDQTEVGECGPRVEEYGLGLYEESYWQRRGARELQEFEQRHQQHKGKPMLLTCVLLSHRKPRFIHDAIRSVLSQTTSEWQLVVIDSGQLFDDLRRYEDAGNVRVYKSPAGEREQAWQHNWCARSGLIQGDLVHYLSDDDTLMPDAFARFLAAARDHPEQSAWYMPCYRVRVRPDGVVEELGRLDPGIAFGPATATPLCRIDGIQAVVRRQVALSCPWLEGDHFRPVADGWWLDRVAKTVGIYRLDGVMGTHRHTPDSAHTK